MRTRSSLLDAASSSGGRQLQNTAGGLAIAGSGPYWLPPHVFVCQTQDCVVFLDARHDKYFGIGGDDAQGLRAALAASASPDTPIAGQHSMPSQLADVLESLVTHGLLTVQPASGRPFRSAELRLGSCAVGMGTEYEYAPQLHHVFWALITSICARLDLRFRGVAGTMERLSAAKQEPRTPASSVSANELRRIVSIFRIIRPFLYEKKDQCLLHGLTLHKFLCRYGFNPTWVIGVRTAPFIAHCWVQHGESVLDDSPEQTLEFTPLVAI